MALQLAFSETDSQDQEILGQCPRLMKRCLNLDSQTIGSTTESALRTRLLNHPLVDEMY